jgi:hypothetical protein
MDTQQVIEDEQLNYDSNDRVAGLSEMEKANTVAAPSYIVVGFDDDCDPLNPQSWSYGYKWMVTCADQCL